MSDPSIEELLSAKEEIEDQLDKAYPNYERRPTLHVERSTKTSGRLAIVVGHTKISPGAYGLPPIDQNEYSFNSQIAAQLLDLAKIRSTQIGIFYRDGIGISGAYQKVNEFGADAVIELHFNAAESLSATGTETLYGLSNSKSKLFAEIVQKKMHETLKIRNRPILERRPGSGERGSLNVNSANAPSVLVEPFFGSSAGDCSVASAHVSQYVDCLLSAFIEFYQTRGMS